MKWAESHIIKIPMIDETNFQMVKKTLQLSILNHIYILKIYFTITTINYMQGCYLNMA